MRRQFLAVGFALFAVVGQANAGTYTDGQWKSAKCGAEPIMPAASFATRESYNRSVALMQTYSQNMRDYLNCAVPESNDDVRAMSKIMTDKVNDLNNSESKFTADAEAATARFRQGS